MSEYRFLNPYNFVRFLDKPRPERRVLGNCPPPPHDRYVGLTGRITCRLKAVTPLFVSDSHAVRDEAGHRSYRFFELDGRPAIPPTSLRGMVRSVFETVTNSCLGVFDKRPLSYRLDAGGSQWLVPARVERRGEKWKLRLLPGTTGVQIKSPRHNRFQGKQYAAWVGCYWPLEPSKTLQGDTSGRSRLTAEQRQRHDTFIKRTNDERTRNPDGVKHGEECYALLRAFQHPHPQIKFWHVVEIRKDPSALPQPGPGERIERGWLCVTNQNVERKHSERFFFRSRDNRLGPKMIDLPEEVRRAYECLVRDYQERHSEAVRKPRDDDKEENLPLDRAAGGKPALSRFILEHEERELKGGELVYAMLEGTPQAPRVKYIAPVAVPRVWYERSLGDLLPGPYDRCEELATLCPACRVFGWVREEESRGDPFTNNQKPTAYAGRVRFSPAVLQEHGHRELPEIPLSVLSSPKPTTAPFYLLNSKGLPDPTVDYNTPGARLRGRKFYRHHEEAKEEEYRRPHGQKDDQNRTLRGALQPGVEFTFEVTFENLAPLELGALLYALELEEGMYHRLGYAKPLGFGSVRVEVDKVKTVDWAERLRSIDPEAGWRPLENPAEYKARFLEEMRRLYGEEFDNAVLADLRALLGKPPRLPIHYPRTGTRPDPEGRNYEWFVGNKRRIEAQRRGKHNLPLPCALPLPAQERSDRSLPLIDKSGQGGTCQ